MFNISHHSINRTVTALSVCLGLWAGSPTVHAAARYIVSADGKEVADTTTRLIWRRCTEGLLWNGSFCAGSVSYLSHQGALQQAGTQATAFKAWRLPNVKELASIADIYRNPNPAIDTLVFPTTPSDKFWSSSPYISNSSYAWYVDFYDGYTSYGLRTGAFATRLVRDQ